MRAYIFAVLCLLPLIASAQIYKTTDEHGNVVYTDKPPASEGITTEQVELEPTNTAPPPPDIPSFIPAAPASDEGGPGYNVSITSPANETTIPMGPGNFSVGATLQPRLQPGHKLQLDIDGETRGEPQTSRSWALTNIFRGAHQLTVRVVDEAGATVATSPPVTVYVHRPSINFRNRN